MFEFIELEFIKYYEFIEYEYSYSFLLFRERAFNPNGIFWIELFEWKEYE